MTTCFLAPDPVQSTFLIPGGNTPGNGAQVFFYVAGSNTKQTVYKDNAANVAWTNPIVLDSGGNLPSGGSVWFPTGQTYKVVWAPANDSDPPASPYRTIDNMAGMNDVSAGTVSEWLTGPTPTFVSATSFTVIGDQRNTLTVGRRVRTTNTGGTVYSTVLSSVFGVLTTVTVRNDSGTLDAGLSAVAYGILNAVNESVPALLTAQIGLLDISASTAGQVAFPTTQNPSASTNVLDDYKEGTWTPALFFGGASTGIVYSLQKGVFTKIGNTVIGSYNVVLSSKGSSVGQASLSQPYFTISSDPGFLSPVYFTNLTTTVSQVVIQPNSNTSGALFFGQYGPGPNMAAALFDTQFSNSTQIYGAMIFRTT